MSMDELERYVSEHDLYDIWTVAVCAIYTFSKDVSNPDILDYPDFEMLSGYAVKLSVLDDVRDTVDIYVMKYRDDVKTGKIPSLMRCIVKDLNLQIPDKMMDAMNWTTTDELVRE